MSNQTEEMKPEKKLFYAAEQTEQVPRQELVVLTQADLSRINEAYPQKGLEFLREASRFVVNARQRGAAAAFSDDSGFMCIDVSADDKDVLAELRQDAKERGWDPTNYGDGSFFFSYPY